ncbi:MAG TPA: MOSC N-terminal beta barrel domain-containing protein [Povalibacter sp.]|uniref:MOSC domain-containing protein n=1 Tax=Povalibacter sp. TaxID=1962978 RepID=UPI002CCF421C|nr:MOSC N-terminal beta barrel domain-containing protein [Povalibacter sp.]HMN43385.1 MOSC N-terminal beta barrel domain-containing protein [Povalibacter sp.]
MATITALNIYPVKSCKGIPLQRSRVALTGLEYDRQWLIVRPNGRFVTQREEPRLALIETALADGALTLTSAQAGTLRIPVDASGASVDVTCWQDRCAAFDMGEDASQWLATHLGAPHRLVRFDPAHKRPASAEWTNGVEALAQFSDAFPFLVISQASLDDLNARLTAPLPMNRFRPNIVIDGVDAYAEDRADELRVEGGITLRRVKPCTRCIITTTNQATAEREGDEPLRTLRTYRMSKELRGVLFGQNAILLAGAGRELRVGQSLLL